MRVILFIIIYDVIGRLKIVFDELRDGFVILGFGIKMKKFLDFF